MPRRGEVYLVSLDPTVGSEISKTRPAVVIQNDTSNRYSPITIVAAITSKFGPKLYPTEVPVKSGEGGLKQESVVLLNQIRSIDRRRLVKKMGILSEVTMKRLDRAVAISLGLINE
jgi:mRNA interferase MazF